MKKKYGVCCTIVYNGYIEVEAENADDAISMVEDKLNSTLGEDDFPFSGKFGGVEFNWGEATADYADEL